MRGYSQAIADRLTRETGVRVEYAPMNLVTPYIVDCVGCATAQEVRDEAARQLSLDEEDDD